MKKMKKEWHTANKKYGMGDYYGSGVRNPIGRMRESMMDIPEKKKSNKKPMSLA